MEDNDFNRAVKWAVMERVDVDFFECDVETYKNRTRDVIEEVADELVEEYQGYKNLLEEENLTIFRKGFELIVEQIIDWDDIESEVRAEAQDNADEYYYLQMER